MSRKKRSAEQRKPLNAPVEEKPKKEIPSCAYDRFFFAVLALAIAFRILFLGRAELWQDELGFLNLSHTGLPPMGIWRESWGWIISIGQLPLSFFIFNLFYRLIELVTGPVSTLTPGLARIPAVLFGMAGVWSTYRLASRVFDRAAARLVALMMAVFFFPVYYARETYCYAQLIALTPLAVSSLIVIAVDHRHSPKNISLLLFFLVALLYSHLGALMIVLAMAACVLGLWIWSKQKKDPETARSAFTAGLTCGAALLIAAPYILRFALYNKAHTAGADQSPLIILNDVISKLFLGEQAWAAILSWVLFISGILSLFLPHPESRPRKLLAWTTLLGVAAVTWATHRSQYLSVRYFSAVSPLILLVMGQGIFQVSRWIGHGLRLREAQRKYVFISLAALPLAVHGLVYTPALLTLTEKSTPFGAVAHWINEHLEPGTPYLMESAYEIRWVGGSYPTPDRYPAAPYVHGGAPQEMARLHDRQIDFMTRFPEAPFIESAHHHWNKPGGLWTWPHRHFSRHVIVGNPEKLKRLIRWGIYPGVPHEPLSDYSYRIDIYYATLEDRLGRARASEHPVVFAYEGWEFQGQQISPQETMYFRLQRGQSGTLQVVNASDKAIQGAVAIKAVLPGPVGQAATLRFLQKGKILSETRSPPGQIVEMRIPIEELAPGPNTISWTRSTHDNPGEGLILIDASWQSGAPKRPDFQ